MYKEFNAIKAGEHTLLMKKEYSKKIQDSIIKSKIYDNTSFINFTSASCDSNIKLFPTDSIEGARKNLKGKTVILNFASYKNPGGGFINGSMAQEEALCHNSFLYNVISQFASSYYKWNNLHKNNSLYFNRAIYSPNVKFYPGEDEEFDCDVITCAAPNLQPYYRYGNKQITLEDNSKALESRAEFIFKIAAKEEIETLVLGAWGCGVFMQNPEEVCRAFLKASNVINIPNIIFAIPDKNSKNYKAFERVILEAK